jgi:hypothetical protein
VTQCVALRQLSSSAAGGLQILRCGSCVLRAILVVLMVAIGAAAPAPSVASTARTSAVATPGISAPQDVIVGEGDGTINLRVMLTDTGTGTVTVNYATTNSTAAAGSACNADFVGASGTLTFAPGETSKLVPVTILDCTDVEGFESFTLNLSGATGGTIVRASGRVGIVDNDTVVATPRLFVRDAVVDERDGVALVSVLMGGPRGQASSSTVTVNYATSDGTATAGSDYTAASGTLTFTPGQTAKTIAIPIADDATSEPTGTLAVNLSSASLATIADGKGVVSIGASDATATSQPGISAPPDLIVGEGDGFVDLPITLTAPGPNTVTVTYTTANSTSATGNGCNADFVGAAGTLTFAPGETTKVVRVDLLDCSDVEGFEAFTLGLSGAVNGTIVRASGRTGIVDNDTVVGTPRLFVRDAVADERDGGALVSVLLGGPGGQASSSTVTVDYSTSDVSATAGADYTAVSGTLTFAPGETAKTIPVPITDDATAEPAETFSVNLSNPNLATIADGEGVVSIGASDATAVSQPGISAPPDLVAGEGDGFVDLPVRLSAPGLDTVTVNYATGNSSAAASNACNADFVGASGALTFAPGETTKVVRVDLLDCNDVESFEAFTITLSSAVNGTITRTSGRIGIIDNDRVVAVPRFFVRDTVVDERDGVALVSVLLGGARGETSTSSVTVAYATGNGTATAGADYVAVSGTLTFAPGETAKTIPVPIVDDGTNEPAETFTFTLSNPSLATIADGAASIMVGASDAGAVSLPGISAPPDAFVGEGDGFIDLPVTVSAPGLNTVTVSYSTANGTSAAGNACNADFVDASGTLTFTPGETTKVVRVDVLDCNDVEGVEAFTLNLSGAVNGTIARATVTIRIVDNDTWVNDFDGDRSSDIAVFRSSEGRWYIHRSSDDGLTIVPFGLSTDIPVPANYDGDARTDIAIYRPSEGRWYIQNSATSTLSLVSFGTSTDVPVPADYDGDGKADVAVFRPSEGRWYIHRSSDNGLTIVSFGLSTDLLVPADYDRDGKADVAVFRPSEGRWYVLRSSDNTLAITQFGLSTDVPVLGDYNGDGKPDIAVFRPSEGRWYVLQSSDGLLTLTNWGTSSDRVEPADYDGDGLTDATVFRPSEGRWYVLQSATLGLSFTNFGLSSDLELSYPYALRQAFYP